MLSNRLLATISTMMLVVPLEAQSKRSITMPSEFIENIVYVRPVTKSGVPLVFYTDSGGGEFVYRSVVDRSHLPIFHEEVDGQSVEEVFLPEFKEKNTIPPPLGNKGKLIIRPDSERLPIFDPGMAGLLGQEWFADRVWTWDYRRHLLLLLVGGVVPHEATAHRVPLGFKRNAQGRRDSSLSFARIQASVDGEVIEFLFDTGASTVLTPRALEQIQDGHPAQRATSFVALSIFDRWHARHPNWKVIEKAEEHTGAAMIEVPSIEVGGYSTGPVWFTARPDSNFTQWMSQWTDQKVYGALGGSTWRYFRITVDYPNATAYFGRP